jgi:hypothetical protein
VVDHPSAQPAIGVREPMPSVATLAVGDRSLTGAKRHALVAERDEHGESAQVRAVTRSERRVGIRSG